MKITQIPVNPFFGTAIIVQLLLYFLYLKTDSYIFLGLYFGMSFPLAARLIGARISIKFIIVCGVTLISFVLFSITSKQVPVLISLYNLLYGLSALIAAYALFKINNPVRYIKFLFWCYTVFILYHFATLGFTNPDAYNEILSGSSRNYLSAIFILLMALLALSFLKEKSNIPLIYPTITFLGCVGLFGRSGIALSAVLLAFCLIRQKSYKLMVFAIIAITVFVAVNFQLIEAMLFEKTNFTNGLSSERTIFIQEYLTGITYDPSNLLFGRRLQDCCEWIILFGNPHNSFIMGHLRYGIVHTIFSIFIILFILWSRNLTFIFFGLIVLSRFFVDQLGLFTPFDVIIYYLMFLIYEEKTRKSQIKNQRTYSHHLV
ncbi:hypothetical protein MSC36_02485 [Acinetobacter baumannii]|uniref:hypothetical protein n=1 Tax=Acinetobacter baumannii TaxID=470 RepID=UPI00294104C0|nr:hypothetical protein [Acinetobacter baumannii]MDV4244925.1 hypothetical protein [Acinetobacter baumannii]